MSLDQASSNHLAQLIFVRFVMISDSGSLSAVSVSSAPERERQHPLHCSHSARR